MNELERPEEISTPVGQKSIEVGNASGRRFG